MERWNDGRLTGQDKTGKDGEVDVCVERERDREREEEKEREEKENSFQNQSKSESKIQQKSIQNRRRRDRKFINKSIKNDQESLLEGNTKRDTAINPRTCYFCLYVLALIAVSRVVL